MYHDVDDFQETKNNPDAIKELKMLDPLVTVAPNTACDLYKQTDIPGIPQRSMKYLLRSVSQEPWISQLTLAALIMASRNYDESSIYGLLSLLNSKIKIIYNYSDNQYKPSDFTNFHKNIDYLLQSYLKGIIPSKDSNETKASFCTRLRTVALLSYDWVESIPFEFRPAYRKLLLPIPNGSLYTRLINKKVIIEDQRKRRKIQVDTLMPYYVELRSKAHIRWNFICRLEEAYNLFLTKTLHKKEIVFPSYFKYIDQNLEYNFILWDIESFKRERKVPWSSKFSHVKPRLDFFPELISIVNTLDNTVIPIDQALWFSEPLKHACCHPIYTDTDRSWLKNWGYNKSSFVTSVSNFIYWSDRAFMKNLQNYSIGLLIPIEQLHLTLSFGMLALDLFTTTGIRINEALQINTSKECLVRLEIPTESKNKDKIIRYSLRLIPKGDKRDELQDNFIGEETKRLIYKIGKILEKHYDLEEDESLPIIPFNPNHKRAHRFKNAPYIFQAYGKHLSDSTISSCVRLLVHDIVKERTQDGKPLMISAHLLRHGFATHAVQVEKIPVDIVGKWLHQKTVAVTRYYSETTDSMVADAADDYLSAIASHINVLDAIERSPQQLRDMYNEASTRSGTLAKVTGGDCTSHGLCKVQLSCIGCVAKVPDPAKKNQIIQHQEWAKKQIVFYRGEGLLPEVRRLEKLITDADQELNEIEQIEQYRIDEELKGKIEVLK